MAEGNGTGHVQPICRCYAQCGRVARAFCVPRLVVSRWCARFPRACAPRSLHSVTLPLLPGSHGTRSWAPSRPPWLVVATFYGSFCPPSSATFPAFLGHLPRLVPRCSMTLQSWSRSLGHVSAFLGRLSEHPPKRPDVSHACMCVLIVRARHVLAAHMFCLHAHVHHAAHAVLMKLAVGCTHMSHSH
ncbi:hypothetical protein PanWU01x14_063300, partial [Parasponia andersonii]